ncbi:hemolysin-III related-domain-containing protein [Infundibulicybe gibba]|nr:hemolysin-III related-domain-containing protein [Infundibulicybe gibba]
MSVTTTSFTTTERDIRLRRARRRLSTPTARRQPVHRLNLCQSLPFSLEALDLSTASPTQTLASLRFLVLSYLAELETRLSQLESPDLEVWKAMGEMTIEDARKWAQTALEMLNSIRTDVCSHLPEFHFTDISVESLKSHFPDLPDVPRLYEMRSHLPDMSDVRSHLPDFGLSDMRSKLDDVRSRFNDMDFHQPLNYIPTLSDHLQNLHSHLASMELPSGLGAATMAPSAILSDLLDSLLSSDLVNDFLKSAPDDGEDLLERAAMEVAHAVKQSFDGIRLIKYTDLPKQWRNNPFVTQGYRFIPIERWPLIIMSLFAFHNETLNIHTHLIPFLLWGVTALFPLLHTPALIYTPETLFMAFALLCLLSSAVWHTMSGCAHRASMDFCARVDYVGIGWLISASVGTVVYYGFQCHPGLGNAFLGLCFLMGVAGNLFPFMEWFNQYEYRFWRIGFFLCLAFSAIGPLATLAAFHSPREALHFIGPVLPSLASYIIGLVFYVTHVPERFLPEPWRIRLDLCIGSHCIWHCFIVLAVSQHRAAIGLMKDGVKCVLG